MERIASGFGHHVDDTAGSMAVLRSKRGRAHLNFLHKRRIDPNSQPAVSALVDAQTTECRIVKQDTVRDIRVFKTGGSRNGRILGSGSETARHAGSHVKHARDAPA